MFETFRKMIVPIIIIILLFFTAMIVLEWGLGFSSRQSFADTNLAAIINGEDITWQEYNNIYNNMLQSEVQQTPEGDISEQRRAQLHEQAWQQMLHDRLLMQEVAKRDIGVTADEIYSFLKYSPPPELQSISSFQTDGKFDYNKYINAMADPQASPFWASLEPYVRSEIMKLKMQEMVVQAVTVSEEEIKTAFMNAKEEVKVGVVNVAFERFSRPGPKVTDEDLRAYFDENPEDFQLDERRTLNIALIEKKPQPYDWEVAYNKAKQIYDSIQAGSDFAEMAKKYSSDGSAKDGGDLGWFDQGQMVPEFDKTVFSMQLGTVSEPVKTQFGWHIIQLNDRKEEMDTPRGKTEPEMVKKALASHILIAPEISQESKDEFHSRLTKFREAADRLGFLVAIEEENIPLRQTAFFFRNGNIQYIGNNPLVSDFAFDNEVNTISDIMENNSAYFIVQVGQIREAGPSTFEEAKDKLQLAVLTEKVMTMCVDTANAIWSEIEAGTDIEDAAKEHGDIYYEPKPFNRLAFVQGLRRDPVAIGTAFSIKEPGTIHPPVKHEQGVAIIKLLERTTPDLSEFNAQRDSIYYAIMTTKQQQIYSQWFDNLVNSSEIVNNVQKALLENPDML